MALLLLIAPAAGADWDQFGGGPSHSGVNVYEKVISATNVSQLQPYWQADLPGVGDGAPAIADGVVMPDGETLDLAFVTTKPGGLVAVDVGSGTIIWRFDPPIRCQVTYPSEPCYTNSSPAIDPNKLYVYGAGADGFVRKFAITTGIEITDLSWPERVTIKPWVEKTSSALTIAISQGVPHLYATNGGYTADSGNYQGHVTTINLIDGSQHVFNTLCSTQSIHLDESTCRQAQSGVWARPGVVYDPATDLIYLVTGNGVFDPANHNWADTVIALHPDGTGTFGDPVDSYTPTNFAVLDSTDMDLGSTAPAIVRAPPGSTVSNLGVQGGKDGKLKLLNMSDLSGRRGAGHVGGELGTVDLPSTSPMFSMPAVWTDPATLTPWIFVTAGNNTTAFTVTLDGSSRPHLAQQWTAPSVGTSPLFANGVLYLAGGSSVRALDATTGTELWSRRLSALPYATHWQSPVLASHVLLVEDNTGKLSAFRLGPPTNVNIPTAVVATPGNFAADLAWSAPTSGPPVTAYTVTAVPSGRTCIWVPGPLTCTIGGLHGNTTYRFQVTATTTLGRGPPSDPSMPVTVGWGYYFHGVTPTRVLDSRTNNGWGQATLNAGAPRELVIAGRNGVPTSAQAVVANVTVTNGTTGSYLTVYPSHTALPSTSNINFAPYQTKANLVTMKLGVDGGLSFSNAIGNADVVVDLVGYYDNTSADGYTSVPPIRALDSRTFTGGWWSPLSWDASRTLNLSGGTNVPQTATTVVANVTVTGSTDNSYVSIWPSGGPQPSSSSINFARGETVANLITMPVGNGKWTFATAVGKVNIIVDVIGYYEAGTGGRLTVLDPIRILDDRTGIGATGPWTGPETRTIAIPPAPGLPPTTESVIVNVTATNATESSYLSVFALQDTVSQPSTLNFAPGQTIANLAIPRLSVGPAIAIFDLKGRVDVIADLAGFFSTTPPPAP